MNFGDLRRVTPISTEWGFDRGQPIDRYYIDRFIAANSTDIRGIVVEAGPATYTSRFGGDRVSRLDVLNLRPELGAATIIADLQDAPQIPDETFDCVILTQVLQLIFDLAAAIDTVHRILRPGGVVLATVSGITHTKDETWSANWCWNFTPGSARRVFERRFLPANVHVERHGNVLSATSFLFGLAAEDLTVAELEHNDPGYDVTIAVRAMKD